jgi:hypothetical protein
MRLSKISEDLDDSNDELVGMIEKQNEADDKNKDQRINKMKPVVSRLGNQIEDAGDKINNGLQQTALNANTMNKDMNGMFGNIRSTMDDITDLI